MPKEFEMKRALVDIRVKTMAGTVIDIRAEIPYSKFESEAKLREYASWYYLNYIDQTNMTGPSEWCVKIIQLLEGEKSDDTSDRSIQVTK